MSKRRLAAFAIPLEHRRWDLLRFDGQQWLLRERLAPCEERPLARIDVVLEGGAWRWLRLRVRVTGWRRLWPPQCHLWLRRRELPHIWPLIGAALALHRSRVWLGQP
jgi:hypothetical protein